jgi:hypothetical protein
MTKMPYNGYLSPYVERIRTMHEGGAGTREIAEALYKLGARADTSDPNVPPYRMRRRHHVTNLRLMVLHVLQRLGLRTRRKRRPRWLKQQLAAGSHDQV